MNFKSLTKGHIRHADAAVQARRAFTGARSCREADLRVCIHRARVQLQRPPPPAINSGGYLPVGNTASLAMAQLGSSFRNAAIVARARHRAEPRMDCRENDTTRNCLSRFLSKCLLTDHQRDSMPRPRLRGDRSPPQSPAPGIGLLGFVRLPLPLLRVRQGRFFDRNIWPDFRVFRIQRQPFLKPRLGGGLDRVDRALDSQTPQSMHSSG